MNYKTAEVEIYQGWYSMSVCFLTSLDIECNSSGRRYRNPRVSSLKRLERVLNGVPARVEFDGTTPYFFFMINALQATREADNEPEE